MAANNAIMPALTGLKVSVAILKDSGINAVIIIGPNSPQ
jgi:hypothetical protein